MEQLKTHTNNPWESLREYTQARIAIGRCGTSIPTKELLDFKMCHAKAIDAVHIPLNTQRVQTQIRSITQKEVLLLHSAAPTRADYLRRPDWGRKLSEESIDAILRLPKQESYDISLVVADGLSSLAIEKNIAPVLSMLIPQLRGIGYSLAPVAIVEQGRVAVADEIASSLNARLTAIFIGERPGLKTPDSLGIYMTYAPEKGTTDERRNCISNVRTEGLSYNLACSKLMYLINEAFRLQISGVNLKDEQDNVTLQPEKEDMYVA